MNAFFAAGPTFSSNQDPSRSRIEFPAVWPYSIYADEFVRRTVCNPGGGERSGLTAHFFFGAKSGCAEMETRPDRPELDWPIQG